MKKVWKNGLESKGLNVNMGKINILIASRDLHALQTSGRYHCEVCRKGVRKNSIFCSRYSLWGRKKCSDTPDRIVKDPDFRCRRCLGNARAIDGRPCVLKSNLQMANLMWLILSILVTSFVQVEVVSLALLKDTALHGENLKKCYFCLIVKQFL